MHAARILLVVAASTLTLAHAQFAQPLRWHQLQQQQRNNLADGVYGSDAYRGGLADRLDPVQRSALTDFLSQYFPRLFRPVVADPAAALPPGASVLPYDRFPLHAATSVNAPAYEGYPAPVPANAPPGDVQVYGGYQGYPAQGAPQGDRGSYLPYPGRGQAYPTELSYPLDPYEAGYRKVVG